MRGRDYLLLFGNKESFSVIDVFKFCNEFIIFEDVLIQSEGESRKV